MNELEKWKLYTEYISKHYGLKHWFDLKIEKEKWYSFPYPKEYQFPKGWGTPDKQIGGLHFRYLWKNLQEPISFSDFCNDFTSINGISHWYMLKHNKKYA
jgi:hypothetical protein